MVDHDFASVSVGKGEHLPPLNICIEVNIDDEASKSGCQPNQLRIGDRLINCPFAITRTDDYPPAKIQPLPLSKPSNYLSKTSDIVRPGAVGYFVNGHERRY